MPARKKILSLEELAAQLKAGHARELATAATKSANNLKKIETNASKRIAKAEQKAQKALTALAAAKEAAKKAREKKAAQKAEKKERAVADAVAEKAKYTVRNWSEYNKALCDRGKISV